MPRKTAEQRFWSKVQKTDTCWLWTAFKTKHGYGQFYFNNKLDYAHRFSYELHKGKIHETNDYHGTCVCHKCDNPACVNPDHLFLGSHQDNMNDMITKKRGSTPPLHLGEENKQAKLSEKEVIEIRYKYLYENIKQNKLAKIYKMSPSQINNIVHNRHWKQSLKD